MGGGGAGRHKWDMLLLPSSGGRAVGQPCSPASWSKSAASKTRRMTSTSSGGRGSARLPAARVNSTDAGACEGFEGLPTLSAGAEQRPANGEGSQWRIAVFGGMQSSFEEGCAQTGVPGHCHAWLRLPPLARLLLLATPRLCCWHHAVAMPCSSAASCGVNAAHACSGIKQELGSRVRERQPNASRAQASRHRRWVGDGRRTGNFVSCRAWRPLPLPWPRPLRSELTSMGGDRPARQTPPAGPTASASAGAAG